MDGDICVLMEHSKNLQTINSEVVIQCSDRTEQIHNLNRKKLQQLKQNRLEDWNAFIKLVFSSS